MMRCLLALLITWAAFADIRLAAAQSNVTVTRFKITSILAAFPETEKEHRDNTGLIALGATGVALFAVALVTVIFRARQKRERDLQALAASLGFTFHLYPTAGEEDLLAETRLWEKGRGFGGNSSSVSNILGVPATDDLVLRVFEFSCLNSDGDSSSMIHYTVARLDSPLLKLPTFILQPSSLATRAKKFVGWEGLSFPENPAFARAFHLAGQDETALRRIFTPAIIHYCEQHPGLTIEGKDRRLIVYRQRRLKAELFPALLEEAKKLLGLFIDASRAASLPR